MQNNCDKKRDVTYAGFWVRLAAYVIDSVIVFFGLLFVRLFSSGIFSMLEGTALGGNVLFDYTLKDIVLYGFQVMYFVLFLYYTGTTPGKRLSELLCMRILPIRRRCPALRRHLPRNKWCLHIRRSLEYRVHLHPPCIDYSGITEHIMKPSLLPVHTRHDIADTNR